MKVIIKILCISIILVISSCNTHENTYDVSDLSELSKYYGPNIEKGINEEFKVKVFSKTRAEFPTLMEAFVYDPHTNNYKKTDSINVFDIFNPVYKTAKNQKYFHDINCKNKITNETYITNIFISDEPKACRIYTYNLKKDDIVYGLRGSDGKFIKLNPEEMVCNAGENWC